MTSETCNDNATVPALRGRTPLWNLTEVANQSALRFAFELHKALSNKIPFKSKANEARTPGSRDYFHSFTVLDPEKLGEQAEASARQVAAGIRADLQAVQFNRVPREEQAQRFPTHKIARVEMLGVYAYSAVYEIPGKGYQVTLITEFDEWRPKQS